MTAPESEQDYDMELSFASEDMEEEVDFLQTLYNSLQTEIDLYVFVTSAAHAKPLQNTTAENLIKLCRIDIKIAVKTLDVTSQNCGRTKYPYLSQDYSTDNKMLWYKRIK